MIRKVKETLYEKFTEENSDPIHDMNIGLGKPVNFDKMAKKTIRRGSMRSMNGRDKWLDFLTSLVGKKLTGRFKGEKEIISIRIKNYHSYYNGTKISFNDDKDIIYEIDLDEIYYVL